MLFSQITKIVLIYMNMHVMSIKFCHNFIFYDSHSLTFFALPIKFFLRALNDIGISKHKTEFLIALMDFVRHNISHVTTCDPGIEFLRNKNHLYHLPVYIHKTKN